MVELPTVFTIAMVVWGAAAVALIVALRLWHPWSIALRRPDVLDQAPAPLAALTFIVLMLWLIVPVGYGLLRAAGEAPPGSSGAPATQPAYTMAELALVGTFANVLVLAVLPALHRALRHRPLRDLGLERFRLGSGVWLGLTGIAIAMPLVFWSGQLAELFYEAVGYQHPNAHELLKALGESQNPLMRGLIVGTAVLLAPVFEELLFRGLLQNLLVRVFAGRLYARGLPVVADPHGADPASPNSADSMTPAPGGAADSSPEAQVVPLELDAPTPITVPLWRIWAAVLLAALLFASIHEAWSAPPIFVLAVCLGYLYQRTGNLWAVIIMHALFNLLNVVQFLLLVGS